MDVLSRFGSPDEPRVAAKRFPYATVTVWCRCSSSLASDILQASTCRQAAEATTIRKSRDEFAHFSAHLQMARHVVIVHPYCQTLMSWQHMALYRTKRKCSSSQIPGTPTATSQDGKMCA